MYKYKLTNINMQTRNLTQWEIGIAKEIDPKLNILHNQLCSPGWFHYYHNPEVAIGLNPAISKFNHPRLFKCLTEGLCRDDWIYHIKGGCTKMTLIEELSPPKITSEDFLNKCIDQAEHKHDIDNLKSVVLSNTYKCIQQDKLYARCALLLISREPELLINYY